MFDDLTNALIWYYERSEDAAGRLSTLFLETIRRIGDFPNAGTPVKGLRRFRVAGFPYSVWFDPRSNMVVALWHDSRDIEALLERSEE